MRFFSVGHIRHAASAMMLSVLLCDAHGQGFDVLRGLRQKAEEAINSSPQGPSGPASRPAQQGSPVADRSAPPASAGGESEDAPYDGYKGSLPPALRENGKLGTILFSKKPVQGGAVNAAALTNQFTANDEIHAIAFLPGTLRQLRFASSYEVTVKDLQTNLLLLASFKGHKGLLDKRADGGDPAAESFVAFSLAGASQTSTLPHITLALMRHLKLAIDQQPKLATPKTYLLTVKLQADGFEVARGSFHYRLGAENFAAIKTMLASLEQQATAGNVLPAAQRNDPVLSGQLRKLMTNYEGRKLVKIVLHKPEWFIERHEVTGVILRRGINAYVVFQESEKECSAFEFYFEDEYVGGKFQNQPKVWGATERDFRLLCANVN